MRYLFLLIVFSSILACNISDSYGPKRITNSIIAGNEISAIPVKNPVVVEKTLASDEKTLATAEKQPTIEEKPAKKTVTKKINEELNKKTVSEDTFTTPAKAITHQQPTPRKKIINSAPAPVYKEMRIKSPKYDPIFAANPYYMAEGFDFPVGKPNADGYFLAQRFGQKLHLGEDWNGVGGGNTDLGDPVYAVADGYISFAQHICCGWGNTVRIIHKLNRHPYYEYVESVSSHLNDIVVSEGTLVSRGDLIGHIGTADGKYSAHLHLELRTFLDMNIGPGYSEDQFGYISPTPFIRQNR